MGCGDSKAVYAPNQPSSSTGPDSNSDTLDNKVKGDVWYREFEDNVKTVTTKMMQAEYKNITDYLTEATECLLLLVRELLKQVEQLDEPQQRCDPINLQKIRTELGLKFGRYMRDLGFFSTNTTAFQPIFLRSKGNTKTDKNIIYEVVDAILICMYLIIILRDKILQNENIGKELNGYVEKPDLVNIRSNITNAQKNLNQLKFSKLKRHLLNKIEEKYMKIYNTDTNLKLDLKQNIESVFRNIDAIYDSNREMNTYENISAMEYNPNDSATIELKNELEQLVKDAHEILMGSTSKAKSKGGSILYKHQIQQIRKLLTNKKLTEKQKEQYKRKINKLKLKIEKEQKLNKINKIKDKLKKANTILKNKKLTDKQKQQLQIKIKNYKNQIKKLSS